MPAVRVVQRMALFFAGFFFFQGTSFFAAEGETDDLAVIAVLPFEDKTGGNIYGYMSPSLAGAIDDSMRLLFAYRPVSNEQVEKTLTELKIKATSDLSEVKRAAKVLGADIIIYGKFEHSKESKELWIYIFIYYTSLREVFTFEPVVNRVDSTLFGATESAADRIVKKMKEIAMVEGSEESAGFELGEDQKIKIMRPKDPEEAEHRVKTLIDKGVAQNREEIIKNSKLLSPERRAKIYDEKQSRPWAPLVLNLVPGFGTGSFVLGDISGAWIGFSAELFSVVSCIAFVLSRESSSCMMISFPVFLVSKVTMLLTPFPYVAGYNRKLKELLWLTSQEAFLKKGQAIGTGYHLAFVFRF